MIPSQRSILAESVGYRRAEIIEDGIDQAYKAIVDAGWKVNYDDLCWHATAMFDEDNHETAELFAESMVSAAHLVYWHDGHILKVEPFRAVALAEFIASMPTPDLKRMLGAD